MTFWYTIVFFFLALYVALARLFVGRYHPDWTWHHESAFRFAKWIAHHAMRRGPEEMIHFLRRLKVPHTPAQFRVRFIGQLINGLQGEWCIPRRGLKTHRVILFFHGGGYTNCSTRTHRDLVARLALISHARVLAINYRLAPEHPFPAALEDAVSTHRWLVSSGEDPKQLVLAGDSAGGGLALATLVALREANDPLPAGAVLISPWVDLASRDESMIKNARYDYLGGSAELVAELGRLYAGHTELKHPLVSPIYADLSGLPPLFIQVGALEILLDQIQRLAAKAKAAGTETHLEVWPGMVHVWHSFLFMPQSKEAMAHIGMFMSEKIP